MSIEKITSKIISEAEAAKESVLAEARKKRDEILAEAETKADQMIKEKEALGRIEKEKVIHRRKSVAEIDCRKVILQKKQELIGRCFDAATETMISMPEAEYVDLLVNLGMAAIDGISEGQLIFNQTEKKTIGEKVAEVLSARSGGKFTVSAETRPIRGGFMVQAGKVYINNTIEALVEEHRENLSSEIASMLFTE